MPHALSRRAALLSVPALAGCTIIDQRSFRGPPPPAPPAPPAPPPVAWGPPPLATIHPAAELDLRTALRPIVTAARRRKPDVAFEVAQTGVSAAAIAALAPTGTAVAEALRALGVRRERITLGARIDAAADPAEIRLYAS